MTENEELEKYNKKFNKKMAKRPYRNIKTCPICNNQCDKHPMKIWYEWVCICGKIDTVCNLKFCEADYGEFRCPKCKGIGYVNNPT